MLSQLTLYLLSVYWLTLPTLSGDLWSTPPWMLKPHGLPPSRFTVNVSIPATVQSNSVQLQLLTRSKLGTSPQRALLNNWGCRCQALPLKGDAEWPLTPVFKAQDEDEHEEKGQSRRRTHVDTRGRRRRTAVVSRWLNSLWFSVLTVFNGHETFRIESQLKLRQLTTPFLWADSWF